MTVQIIKIAVTTKSLAPVLKITVTPNPFITGRVDVRFPANVRTENFLTATYANGGYIFGVDYSRLAPGPVIDPASAFIAIDDQISGFYRTVSLASLLVSGLDIDLQAIAALTETGILSRTADGVWALRTLIAPAAGLTITNPGGVAGNQTFALANDLAALEGLGGTGLAVRSAADTWVQRSLVAPAAGLTITNPAGIAGNLTFALANDLAALEALASTGFAARTAADSWAQRLLQAPAAGFTIANPAGIAGDPTFALANDLAALEAISDANVVPYRTGTDAWSTMLSGNLTAFAGLTALADKLPYFNGGGTPTMTTADFTAFARTLLDDTTQAQMRATLGLTPGTDVQPFDADLSALAANAGTGLWAVTGAGTGSVRTITGPAAGLTVTNGSGAAGNPTLALANDLAALEGLGGTGLARRTGADAWSVGTAVANSELAQMAAFTFKGNNSGGAATPTDVDIGALAAKASPAGTDEVLLRDNDAAGAWKRAAVSSVSSAGSVSSIASLTGAFTLSTGITNSGNDIRLNRGHLPGEPSNGSAAAGEIGEYVTASGSIACTSGVLANVVSFSLPAGDWDLNALGFITAAGATTLTNYTLSLSTVSASHNTGSNDRYNQLRNGGGIVDPIQTIPVGPFKMSLSATTTVYVVYSAQFTNTLNISVLLRARRMH